MKIKIEVSDDTTTCTITKEFTRWTDVFPDFLNALRGAGFSIDENVAVYMPGELAEEFGSGDEHILYDSDLVQPECILNTTMLNFSKDIDAIDCEQVNSRFMGVKK